MLPWESFRFCPQCGNAVDASRQGNATKPFDCDQCEFTYYFNPGIGVAGIIVDHDKRLMLLRRGRDPHRGQLGLPGGFVDIGEGVDDALRREVREEVNLTVDSLEFLCSHANTYTYKNLVYHLADVFFVCNISSMAELKCDDDEITEILFIPADQLDLSRMAFQSNRLAMQEFIRRL